MNMTVILNDYIEHLGERGDSVKVKPGYARNYLLPKGLAYIDTPGNRKRFDEEQHRWEEMDLKRRSAAESIFSEMQGLELIFERRAGEKDVLFGSVTSVDIAKELVARGFDIDKRRVLLSDPIKELGSTTVDIHVHRDINVTVPIHVVRPGEQPKAAEAEEAPTEDADATEAAAETGDDGVAVE
jgi:large subunit ribosomal protein L9